MKIDFTKPVGLKGESAKLFDSRLKEGFWDRYVRYGIVIEIGYKGGENSVPIFNDAIGLDVGTPGYDGKHIPYDDGSIGTIYTSHLLEHISDYKYFFKECFRALVTHGTLILIVPLKDTYERREAPPSRWNYDHKRFYTSVSLLKEIEETFSRNEYRVIHLRERFRPSDLLLPIEKHAVGPYEIECVIEKISPHGIY